jgi:thiaminase (transcriptional activator TenA)
MDGNVSFADTLVEANKDLWDAMAAHPWVRELAAGTLPEEALVAWAQQCRLFCMQEHSALLILRSLNPSAELGTALDKTLDRLLAKLEDDTIREPLELAETLRSLKAGVVEEAWPVCLGYGSFVISAAYNGILEGLGAVYAVEKAYLDTWTAVLPSVPPESRWYDWVSNWTQDLFRETVDGLGDCVNQLAGPTPSEEVKTRMGRAFHGVAQFELAFWEMSWKQQGWPNLSSTTNPEG